MKTGALTVRKIFWIELALALAVLIVFAQTLRFGFINFDDNQYITENIHFLTGLTTEGVRWAFSSIYAYNWHPLTWISHMVDVSVFGLNAGGHHLVNVCFHLFSTLILFAVLRKMTGTLWRSAFVSALFALHPLHVESVAWIAERKDVLSTFMAMVTLWAYARYADRPTPGKYFVVVVFFAFSLMSKPMLVTLPAVMLLLDAWPLGRSAQDDCAAPLRRWPALFLEKVPLFVLSVLASVVTVIAQRAGGSLAKISVMPISVRIANAIMAYAGYIRKMFWPDDLAVFYPHPGMPPGWELFLASLFLLAISVWALISVKKHPWFLVGWLWYLGTLVPVIGLVQVGSQAMADRYTYFPLIGLFIILVWATAGAISRWRCHRRNYGRAVIAIASILFLAGLMGLSFRQTAYWKDSVTLFSRAVSVTRGNYLAKNNLGVAYADQGRLNAAALQYRAALDLWPDYPEAHNNLGRVLISQGDTGGAVAHFSEAVRLRAEFADARMNLANALMVVGRPADAIKQYAEALRYEPENAEIYYNFALALARLGRRGPAINYYREALALNPNLPRVHNNLGVLLLETGDVRSALWHFKEALRLNPAYAGARLNLDRVMAAGVRPSDDNGAGETGK